MYLIDTNILIYYLGGEEKSVYFIQHHKPLAISVISVIEVLSYPFNPEERKIVEDFLKENFIWLEVSEDIIFKTAEIRLIKKTKTPDAIIGATAICHRCQLVSRNTKDFAHLPVDLLNLYES